MTDRIAPNPPSPYANAEPRLRHLFPGFVGLLPDPESLALTACERLAVVPTEPLQDFAGAVLPPGLCGVCVDAMHGQEPPPNPNALMVCSVCGLRSRHGRWCALCRIDLHTRHHAAVVP